MTNTTAEKQLFEKSDEEKIYVAPPLLLMWWKFRKHKMAVISGVVIILLYLVAIFCEAVAPYDPNQYFAQYKLAPPTKVHIIDSTGRLRMPFVYKIVQTKDKTTMRSIYTEDKTTMRDRKSVV